MRHIRIAGRTDQRRQRPTADLTERTVETHATSVMTKLDLYNDGHEHRRVLAVRTWLGIRRSPDPVSGTEMSR